MRTPESPRPTKDTMQLIQKDSIAMVERLRRKVRSQVPLWPLVPGLALAGTCKDTQYDTGGSVKRINPDYAVASRRGVFPVRTSDGRKVYIELHTGEFGQACELREISQVEARTEVPTSTILSLVADNPDSLDAVALVERLLKEMKKPDINPSKAAEYRADVRESEDLAEPDIEEIERTLANFRQ